MVVLLLMFGWMVGWLVGSSSSSRPGYNQHEEQVKKKRKEGEEEEEQKRRSTTNKYHSLTHSPTQLHHRSLEEKNSLLTDILLPSLIIIRALPTNVSVTLLKLVFE